MTDALFAADGDRWVPTELSRGPWDPVACHGGPVAALLARAVEQFGNDPVEPQPTNSIDWQIARITIELTRPVPVGRPLEVVCELERPGKRVSLVGTTLLDDGVEVARARTLRIRDTDVSLTDATVHPVDDPPGTPGEAPRQRVSWAAGDLAAFHSDACEHRFTEGAWDVPGPVGVWIRLLVPVVEGETPSGVQRAVAAADFGNGVSAGLPYDDFLFINPDLTVHLLRRPMGEWIGMRTASHYSARGAGMAESALYDLDGRVGRSVQSLFVDAR